MDAREGRPAVGRGNAGGGPRRGNGASKKGFKAWFKKSGRQILIYAVILCLLAAGVSILIGLLATQNYDKSRYLPSNFGQHYTSWRAYVPLAGIAYACAIVFVSTWPFFIVASDSSRKGRGPKSWGQRAEQLKTPAIGVGLLLLGSVIICGQFSYTWDYASADVQVVYAPFSGEVVNATVTMRFGLRGVNISLVGTPDHWERGHILFNEHYGWARGAGDPWAQGRNGYGKYAGNFNHWYRMRIEGGVPIAIQELSEYLTLDGERIRFGRDYRVAGYYTWIINWLAFGEWAIGTVFLTLSILHTDTEGQSDIMERRTREKTKLLLRKTGLDFSFLSAACMLWACLNWYLLRPADFAVPFPAKDGSTAILKPERGQTFWLFIVVGLIAAILAAVRNIYDVCSQKRTKAGIGIEDRGWFGRLAASLQQSPRWLVVNFWMVAAIGTMWLALLRGQRKLHPNKSYFQQGSTAWEQLNGKSVLYYPKELPKEAYM